MTIVKGSKGKQRQQEGKIYKKLQADPRRLAKLQSSETEKSIRHIRQRYYAPGEKRKNPVLHGDRGTETDRRKQIRTHVSHQEHLEAKLH